MSLIHIYYVWLVKYILRILYYYKQEVKNYNFNSILLFFCFKNKKILLKI